MFDAFRGLSKKEFLATRVIPANDNDAFNDNKCTVCWDPYDQDHPGVRVLPCNHVFGGPCLHEMITGPTGDLCPLCRIKLFQPSMLVTSQRLLEDYLDDLNIHVLVIYHYFLVCWSNVPAGLRNTILFCLDFYNLYFYAENLVNYCTTLTTRNPGFDLDWVRSLHYVLAAEEIFLRLPRGRETALRPDMFLSAVWVMLSSVYGGHDKLSNLRDRTIFFFIILGSALLKSIIVNMVLDIIFRLQDGQRLQSTSSS